MGKWDYLGRLPGDGGFAFTGHEDEKENSQDVFFKDKAGGRDHPNVAGGATGKDFLNHLKKLSQENCCIRNLRIGTHRAAKGGLGGAGTESIGFYINKEEESGLKPDPNGVGWIPDVNEEARDIEDLGNEIYFGTIKFCRPCKIELHVCSINPKFAAKLAEKTGCYVIYARARKEGDAAKCVPAGDGVNDPWKVTDGGSFEKVNSDGRIEDLGRTYTPTTLSR